MTFFPCSYCDLQRSLGLTLVIAFAAIAVLLGLRPAPASAPGTDGWAFDGTLRACVLSHDMPLSTERPDEYSGKTGLYLDLAKAMAQRQDADLQSHFAVTAFYKRPVQEGLLANKCDAYFGLPRTDGPWFIRNKVALTKSFTSIGYALALPTGQTVSGLADLKGKTVAVQGGSPGAIAVSYVEGVNTMTYRFAMPALEALEAGEVDAALVWGPKAGYYVKHISPGAFDVHATTLEWPVAIGVRAEDRETMIPVLESLIDQTEATVADLRAEYGLPNGEPIKIELRGPTTEGDNYGDASRHAAPEEVWAPMVTSPQQGSGSRHRRLYSQRCSITFLTRQMTRPRRISKTERVSSTPRMVARIATVPTRWAQRWEPTCGRWNSATAMRPRPYF